MAKHQRITYNAMDAAWEEKMEAEQLAAWEMKKITYKPSQWESVLWKLYSMFGTDHLNLRVAKANSI